VPLVDKVKVDVSLAAKAKLAIAAEKEEERKKKCKKANEELPVVKYLTTQVSSWITFPAPPKLFAQSLSFGNLVEMPGLMKIAIFIEKI
jgi:hypothetical protein